jgi:AraC family transcriptional regulator
MIHYTAFVSSSQFRVGRFEHPQGCVHEDPVLEVSSDYAVNRVEQGGFAIVRGRRRWDLKEGDLFLNYPGMEYRCIHRDLMPSDVCVSVEYSPERAARQTFTALQQLADNFPVLPSSNRLSYLFLGLLRGEPAEMFTEEIAYAILVELRKSDRGGKPYRRRQLRWYAERIDAVRQHLERQYSSEQSLASLAASVGMSPFHFARIFRELTGKPPHAYLVHVRLQQAAAMLRGGATVTDTCFSCGFQNLAHFSRAFQRRFGIKPSAIKTQPSPQLTPEN